MMVVIVAAPATWGGSAAADLHPVHKDAKGGCAACHVAAPKGEGEWKAIGHGVCVPCHKEFGERPLPAGSALVRPVCAPCHPAGAPRTPHDAPPSIVYPHAAHKDAKPCAGCHAVKGGAMTLVAAMYDCVICHENEGRRMTCRTCHASPPAGAAPATAKERDLAALLPKEAIPGMRHDPGWGRTHGRVATARAAVCRECHDDKACAACHLGAGRKLVYHTPDWNAVHGIAAKKKTTECGGCHAAQTFCAGCHQRTGAAPYGATAAQPKSRHPQGWNAPVRTAAHHSFAAQRDIGICASCHDESACTACHASREKGGKGVNPHAAGFATDCGSYLSRNDAACLKCHQRIDLKRRCLPGIQILPPR